MSVLVDTSVLGGLANQADPLYAMAHSAVAELHHRGELLHVAPQNLIEFRNFATRPISGNGLGLSAVEAEAKAAVFEASLPLLPEPADIYPQWKALVQALGVIGKQVYDARLVAICHVHAVTQLL